MKSFGHVASAFWTRGSGKRLRGDSIAQTIGLYLVSAPTASALGVYYLPLVTIANDTGHPVDVVLKAIRSLTAAEFAYYDEDAELVWVPNLPLFDVGESLKEGDKRGARIRSDAKALGDHRFVREFWNAYSEKYSLGPYPFTGKVQREQGASNNENGASTIPEAPGGEGRGGEVLSLGESVRGGTASEPPSARQVLVDVSVTPDVAQAFADGVSAVTKVECSDPTGKPARDLIAACAKHSKMYGDDLIAWTRTKASEWARTNPFEVKAWNFVAWLDGGSKQRGSPQTSGKPNGRTVQPMAENWKDDDSDRPWETAR